VTPRTTVALGAVLAGLAVAAGAFGAHALRARLSPEHLSVFETAARYQMYHGLGLILVGILADRWPSRAFSVAAWLFVAGIFLFSGSLYALTVTGVRGLGAVTPLGGVCFLAGWASATFAAGRAAAVGR
jgi:uncharacterized membrane protein YgdD (TMEM256/DUF423 family)